MKVRNFENNNGKRVLNQLEVTADDGSRIFQSYDNVIAKVKTGVVTLDVNKWNYSPTTSKYRNQFLNETTKETERKIASGEYKLDNLNE